MKKITICSLFFVLTILLLAFITGGHARTETPPVNTHSGTVVGVYKRTVLKKIQYASYRGIPYAEPPLKSLRFKPPVPIKPWKGKFRAFKDPPKCIQKDRTTLNIEGSEDCLYLNVYVPQPREPANKKSKLKAVIVWIHGGAFTTGNGNSSFYGPDFLLEKHVVVVSVQYRVGPFGFLNMNHPGATGNAGLKDQNLALKWVHRNIINFGGDPQKVTILGQSAGGVSVDLHKISKMSAGLFVRTISMSASPTCLLWAFQTNVEASMQAYLLTKKLGIKSQNKDEVVKELYGIPAEEVIEQASKLPLVPFRPTVENSEIAEKEEKFITECTPKSYKEGHYNKGAHMMGFTADEILFLANSLDDVVKFTVMAPKFIKAHTPLEHMPFTSKILSIPAHAITNLTKLELEHLIDELSELYFITGIDKKQRMLSSTNDHPIFYYYYGFQSNYSAHRDDGIEYLDGVAHEDELPHIFYRSHLGIPLHEKRISLVRERLVRMWTNFAKYGHPTPPNKKDPNINVIWPDSREYGQCLKIDDNLTVAPRPINIRVKFYESIGLGDSTIFNDCKKESFRDVIHDVVSIPRNFVTS